MTVARAASVHRKTAETDIKVELTLDGTGAGTRATGWPFLDHMLDQIARHGRFDLTVTAVGDWEIDAHHTTEDVGITLGQALDQALSGRKGIGSYGEATVPLDEALTRVVIDLSGRPGLFNRLDFPSPVLGGRDIEVFHEFFQGLVNHGRLTLHLDSIQGHNNHHVIESAFKALGRALRQAVILDGDGIPSTKGVL